MTEVRIYSYSNCSSCKKAEALLNQLGVNAVRRDLFKDQLSAKEISALFAETGLEAMAVLSTRSRPYAALGLAERKLSDSDIVELMSEYPALLKRPIIVKNGRATIGMNATAIAGLIGSQEETT